MTTNMVLRGMTAICTPSRCITCIGRAPVLARCQTQRSTVVSTGHAAVRHARSLTSSPFRIPLSASRHSLVITRAAATEAPVKQLADQQQGEPDAPEQLETVLLDVGGMKCGGCSAAVKRMLSARPEVSNAAVNLLTETAAVQLKLPSPSAAEDLAAMLTSKGFPATVRQNEGDAVDTTELEQKREQEARQSMVNLGVAWSLVLLCCTHHAGHLLHSVGLHSLAHSPILDALSNPLVSGVLGAFALLGPGRQLLLDGFKSLAMGNPNMNSLVAVGSTTSFSVGALSVLVPGLGFGTSFLEEPVMLLAFVLLGRALEARAKVEAAADLRGLAQLIPDTARLVLDPGAAPGKAAAAAAPAVEYLQVATSTVRAGDVVRVLPGERIPVDGIIVEGSCAVDEAMLTGESRLVAKTPGSSVTGGTVNYEGPISVKATSTGKESTLAGIGKLVTEAQARDTNVQRVADVVAGRFCYGVMAASAATFAFWHLLGTGWYPHVRDAAAPAVDAGYLAMSHGASFLGPDPDLDLDPSAASLLLSIKLAVDVLVVACPCALGLATPTAVLVASSLGAKRGLLIRGGDVLEKLAAVDTVVLDKTGTLTEGRLALEGVAVEPGCSEDQVLALAAAAEATTRHPLADAVLAEAQRRGLPVASCSSSVTEPGHGVVALVEGQQVLVGKRDWVMQALSSSQGGGSSSSSSTALQESQQGPGLTQVWVAHGGQLLGCLRFRDMLRPDACSTVQQLRQMGIAVHMLSGDDSTTAAHVAQQAGLDAALVRGNQTPQDKLLQVQALREAGKVVAMVGDGVNDAPALAAADVGVALRGGMDAAGAASSVVLMGDRLGQLLDSLALGRATLAKVQQNLAWALMYNVVGIPLAAGALLPEYGVALNPSVAAGMMAFSSIAVVSNSLLLRQSVLGGKTEQEQGQVGQTTSQSGQAA